MNNTIKTIKKVSLLAIIVCLTACETIPTPQQSSEKNDQVKQNHEQIKLQARQQQILKVDDIKPLPPAVKGLLAQAKVQQENGDTIAAISTLERAIRIAPRHPESYYYLGELYFATGNNAQASVLAQRAISLGATGDIRQQAVQLINKTAK